MAKKTTEQRQTYHIAYLLGPENERIGAAIYVSKKAVAAENRNEADKILNGMSPQDLLDAVGLDDTILHEKASFFIVTMPAKGLSCVVLEPKDKVVRYVDRSTSILGLFTQTTSEGGQGELPDPQLSTGAPVAAAPTASSEGAADLPSGAPANVPVGSSTGSSPAPSEASIQNNTATPPTGESPVAEEEESREPVPDIPGI